MTIIDKASPSTSAGAYLQQSGRAIRSTAGLLRRLRAFIRSPYTRAVNPMTGSTIVGLEIINKEAAQRLLTWLVHVAINRKAGLGDLDIRHDCRYLGWIRDQRRLFDIRTQRMRVYQFETPEVCERFAHLLASHDD